MPTNDLLVLFKASFDDAAPNQYWKTFVLTIRNHSDKDIQDPLIGLKNPLHSRGVSLANSSGTTGFVVDGGNVTFRLDSALRPLKARSERQVTLAYSHPQGGFNLDTLPAEFSIDGQPAAPVEGKTPPSSPRNLRVVSTSANSLRVVWDAPKNPHAIDFYRVQITRVGTTRYSAVETTLLGATLPQLEASSDYSLLVYAVDVSGNSSQSSNVIRARTTEPLSDMGDWTVRRAPFLDYAAWPTPQLAMFSVMSNGLDGYFLGFLTSEVSNSPGPGAKKVSWGGHVQVEDANGGDDRTAFAGDASVSDYGKRDFGQFRATGGQIILSFGGAASVPIEEEETDLKKLVTTYEAIISNYEVTHLDFSFEGRFLSNMEALDRHIQAITELRQRHPKLQISYTLPTDGQPDVLEGFHAAGVAFINVLAQAGLEPSLLNGMLMDFGPSAPKDQFEACRIALEGMHRQIKEAFPGWSDEKVWRRMGACPMFGRNNNGRVFTLDNQRKLVTFALEKDLGCLSGWDATRDCNQGAIPECDDLDGSEVSKCTYVSQAPFDFSKLINTYRAH
jgi:chitinase